MRYKISYDLITPGKNYQALYDALAAISAQRTMLSEWVTKRHNTTAAGLRDYLWRYMDGNDRRLMRPSARSDANTVARYGNRSGNVGPILAMPQPDCTRMTWSAYSRNRDVIAGRHL